MASYVPFDQVARADLHIDSTYGSLGADLAGEPLQAMFRCGNQGGFRQKRNPVTGALSFVALFSTLDNPDWPDHLDEQEGVFVYYGDNKKPGDLHVTKRNGNKILAFETFGPLQDPATDRSAIPPFFIFTRGAEGRDVVFRGLAAPGVPGLSPMEQLVAVWKVSGGFRFQNYKAYFTVLDEPVVARAWIDDLLAGNTITTNTPASWVRWVLSGHYDVLRAEPTVRHRTRLEQLPSTAREQRVVDEVYRFYRAQPIGFERAAAELFRMADGNVLDYEVTRPWRDGGRDALGHYRIGSGGQPVEVEFALEAKCFEPGKTAVGVKPMSRLISRLQHRQFGVMVTTSYVHPQAYQEVVDDGHPVMIMAAQDIVDVLTRNNYSDSRQVEGWLRSVG
jgi:hypothetical protein